ncbi:MAG TPA: hypothetical protein VIU13_03205 [Chryseolinea sp.]
MKREIKISGIYKLDNKAEPFSGAVTFDEKEDSIYYSWKLTNKDGQLIAGKSLNVTFQQVPDGQDRFEFSKEHAIEGIRKYRIGREKIVQELNVS